MGYWGWGNETKQLVHAIDEVEASLACLEDSPGRAALAEWGCRRQSQASGGVKEGVRPLILSRIAPGSQAPSGPVFGSHTRDALSVFLMPSTRPTAKSTTPPSKRTDRERTASERESVRVRKREALRLPRSLQEHQALSEVSAPSAPADQALAPHRNPLRKARNDLLRHALPSPYARPPSAERCEHRAAHGGRDHCHGLLSACDVDLPHFLFGAPTCEATARTDTID
jgi:hypothetical protein